MLRFRTVTISLICLVCLTLTANLTFTAEPAAANQISTKAPKNPGAKARALAKIVPCTNGMEFNPYASDDSYYSYMCWTDYDDVTVSIDIFNYSTKSGKKLKKSVLNEWCFDSSTWVLFTDFKNYSWDGSYRSAAATKALLKKFKKLYKNSVAYSRSSNGTCKQIK
jgi:hypothetical protein